MANNVLEDDIELVVARKKNLDDTIKLVQAYHRHEELDASYLLVQRAVYPLLKKQNELGRIYLIHYGNTCIGYIALCFGYSIEFNGRDAFIDEFFIEEAHRSKGFGKEALRQCLQHASSLGINAVHLESRKENKKLQSLYKQCGFAPRKKYNLMTCALNQ